MTKYPQALETSEPLPFLKKIALSVCRSGLTQLLRPGRITRLLPRVRGFYKLRSFYQRALPKDFLVRTRFHDLLLDVQLTDNFGLLLWHYPDFYEKEMIEAFCSLIVPGSVVVDVGANFGLYSLLAAKRGARVFAIEADARNAARLRHNVRLNGMEQQVTIFEMAATDTDKTVCLYRTPENMGECNILEKGTPAGSIQGKAIDSLDLPPIDVCKMDIEGAEFMALKGMQRTLERSPQIKLFVEYAEVFRDSRALLEFLRKDFQVLRVMEAPGTDARGEIPPFCNIFATKAADQSTQSASQQ
jgi:FkbM family methyltransferase